jgi:hypothetical protein
MNEGTLWRKINPAFYVNVSRRPHRTGIDDPNRSVWKEDNAKLVS